jgi:hypothetical protein
MSAPLNLWVVRALWLALPFTLLESIIDATSSTPDATRLTAQALFWVLWAAAFLISLLPLPSTLTILRILTPLAPAASLCAAVVTVPDAAGWAGLAVGTVATVIVMSAPVGDWFVDGASYGDERRFALRPPMALLLGPLPVAWLLTVGPLLAGILLFANGVYPVGVPLVLFGIATAWWGVFATWRLARRWLVFVPAGVTLVDDMALAEPVLFARRALRRIGPAHVDSAALDLSVGAPGLVIEMALTDPVELVPAIGRDKVKDPREVDAVLVVPSRPGTVLDHAESRSLPVSRD